MPNSRWTRTSTALIAAGLCGAYSLVWAQSACDKAWADYQYFKDRNTMDESQYRLTVHGAAVRAACGPEALPVPPGSDDPPRVIVRKPKPPPPKPEEKPRTVPK